MTEINIPMKVTRIKPIKVSSSVMPMCLNITASGMSVIKAAMIREGLLKMNGSRILYFAVISQTVKKMIRISIR